MAPIYAYTWRRSRIADVPSRRVNGPRDVAAMVADTLEGAEAEHLLVLCLNTRNLVEAVDPLYIGTVSAAGVRVGELFRTAVRLNAAAIIIVHNHPSGDATPSPDDLHLTAEAVAAGRLLDIPVRDHVIYGGPDTWTSLRDRGVAFDH